jgi:hypothetical protein
MQALAKIADSLDELSLDKGVHIFVGAVDERWLASAPFENVPERRRHLRGFGAVEDAHTDERVDPRQAARHIVFEEASVEAKRRPELESNRIGLAAETT